MFNKTDMAVMERVRRQIDPLELSNRGKMFPGPGSAAPAAHGMHPLEKAGVITRE
jgi:glycolate oxidase